MSDRPDTPQASKKARQAVQGLETQQLLNHLHKAEPETRRLLLSEAPLEETSVRRCCQKLEWVPSLAQNTHLPEQAGRWIGEALYHYMQQEDPELDDTKAWLQASKAVSNSSVSVPREIRRQIFEEFRDHPPQGTSGYLLLVKMGELQTLFELDWWWELTQKRQRWRQVGEVLMGHPDTRGEDVPKILKTFPDTPPLEALRKRRDELLQHPEARKACLRHSSSRVVGLLLPGQDPHEACQICERLVQISPTVGARQIAALEPEEREQLPRSALLPFLTCPESAARETVLRTLGEGLREATTTTTASEATPAPLRPTEAEGEGPRKQNS